MSSGTYYTMIRTKDHKFDLRLRMVLKARAEGIRAATRAFGCSRNTVRKWLRRYEQSARSGLKELSRAPHHCPHKTEAKVEQKVLEARKRCGYGGERLVREFRLPCCAGAAKRILRQKGLTRKPRRKHQTKNDLRAVKAKLAAFEHFQMDTKPLFDIPEYYPYIKRLGLPLHQYSIREVPTGAVFVSYASELSTTYACLCVKRFLEHLRKCGKDLSKVHIYTDNGAEFGGGEKHERERGFHALVEKQFGANHHFNPPATPNANADVESFHNLVQREFFERERFESRTQFLAAITTYQNYFNLARPISTKGYRTPLEVLNDKDKRLTEKLLLLNPVFLDTLFSELFTKLSPRDSPLDHDVPIFPAAGCLLGTDRYMVTHPV
jgi:transposase InsO family protein